MERRPVTKQPRPRSRCRITCMRVTMARLPTCSMQALRGVLHRRAVGRPKMPRNWPNRAGRRSPSNEVLATINTMVVNTPSGARILPTNRRRQATEGSPRTLTKLTQQSPLAEVRLKEALLVTRRFHCERGWFDIRMDFDTNILGEIKIVVDRPRPTSSPTRTRASTTRRTLEADVLHPLLELGRHRAACTVRTARRAGYPGLRWPAVRGGFGRNVAATFGDPEGRGASVSLVSAMPRWTRARIECQFKQLTMRKFFVNIGDGRPKRWRSGCLDRRAGP